MLPSPVSDHYRAQQRLTVTTLSLVLREWARMGEDLDRSWGRVGPRITTLVTAAQLGAAKDGAAYVPDALEAQDIALQSEATVDPRAFAGSATTLDGLRYGSLTDLLYGAVVHARKAQADTLYDRLSVGFRSLSGLVHTQLADASRMAASTTISATHGAGWVRLVNPPCCQRCAVLAGKLFESNSGFQRHPQCDCRHIPTTEAKWHDVGIHVKPDDIKDLTKAQRQAIDDGADLSRVVNSHRAGKRTDDLMNTYERSRTGRRLTPEGIYKVSATRDEALKRLRDNGYLL